MASTVVSILGSAAVAVGPAAFIPHPLFDAIGVAVQSADFLPKVTIVTPVDDDPLRGINRIVTGRESAALDAPPRGTHGLMPPAWGTVESFDIDDAGVDFEIRHKGGRLLASGQSSGRLTLQMTLRMPTSAAIPERGDTFLHPWRGSDRQFVVWNVSPVYGLRSLRKVDVQARHELDLGNRDPVPVPAPSYPSI